MVKKINRTQEIKSRLRSEGKLSFLDQPQHVAAIVALNEQMEAVKREYQIKERRSQSTAENVILS